MGPYGGRAAARGALPPEKGAEKGAEKGTAEGTAGLWHLLEAAAAGSDRPAVRVGGAGRVAERSWPEFTAATRGWAAELARGLAPGERVGSLQLNTPRHAETYFAAAGAGLVLQPLNTRWAAPELAEVLRRGGARRLVADPELARSVADAIAEATPVEDVLWTRASDGLPSLGVPARSAQPGVRPGPRAGPRPHPSRPSDPAQLYYTSGTTGAPKGVVLTHGNVAAHARHAVEELSLGPDDVWGHFAPMFHLADAWAVFAVTLAGGTHAFLPRFEAGAALDAIAAHRVTLTNVVPTMLGDLLAEQRARPRDLSSLRVVLSGGAPIAPATVRAVLDVFGCDYVQTYGMTETSPYLTLGLLHEHLRALPREEQLVYKAKTGRAFRGVELEVVDPAGRAVPADGRTVGEIRVRGTTVSPGYWQDPEATAAAFRDGWLHTGDLAVLDAEGYVDIVDRAKDMILTGGENVYSIEVENVLYDQPAVREAAVVGLPDERWGEAVHAAVAAHEGRRIDGEALRAACRARLAGYKVPVRIHALPALPRTGSGKIDKRALRGRLAGAPA